MNHRTLLPILLMTISTVCRAGDDSDCSVSSDANYPKDGATDVPLNPIFVIGSCYLGSGDWCPSSFTRLEDENGNEIATEVAFTFDPGTCEFDVYRPISNLEPNTTYIVFVGESTTDGTTFTTGTSDDHEAPVVEVGDSPIAGSDQFYPYSSNEELAMMTYQTTSMGTTGHIEEAPITGELNGYRSTTFYDFSGNSTTVKSFLEWEEDCSCEVVGPRSRRSPDLLGFLVQFF